MQMPLSMLKAYIKACAELGVTPTGRGAMITKKVYIELQGWDSYAGRFLRKKKPLNVGERRQQLLE